MGYKATTLTYSEIFLFIEFLFELIFVIDIFNGLLILLFKKEVVLLNIRVSFFLQRLFSTNKEKKEQEIQEKLTYYKGNIQRYGKAGLVIGLLVVGKFAFVVRDLIRLFR